MAAPNPQIEWIPGDSRDGWLVGSVLVVVALGIAFSLILIWLVPWSWEYSHRIEYSALTGALTGVAIFVGLTAWGLFVPMPACRLGVSPSGIVINYGARAESWPWSRTMLDGNRLYLLSKRLGFVTRLRLNSYQAARLTYLRWTLS